MSEFNSKMTALADEIRNLSGSNTAKGIDDMTNDVNEANVELTTQENLISQLSSILDSKASGGSGDENIDTCTVTIDCSIGYLASAVATILSSDNKIDSYAFEVYGGVKDIITIENVVCGSVLTVVESGIVIPGWNVSGAQRLTVN